jgi:flavin-dependent dehydrogenase
MPAHDYDVIVAGGGLGGSALAKVMAGSGARVLVLEQEARFNDRVRGEFLPPWGSPKHRGLALRTRFEPAHSASPTWRWV